MPSVIRNLYATLYRLKLRERMLRPPRRLKGQFDPTTTDYDTSRVFTTAHARSPWDVPRLMQRYRAETLEQLLDRLPSRRYKHAVWLRFKRWIRFVMGWYAIDVTMRDYRRRQARARRGMPARRIKNVLYTANPEDQKKYDRT